MYLGRKSLMLFLNIYGLLGPVNIENIIYSIVNIENATVRLKYPYLNYNLFSPDT